MAAHGGTVEAHSEGIGRGSELTVRLPIAKPVAAAATIPPQATAAPSGRRPRRVLVVDDNEDAADLLAEVLRADGHEVEVAYHSADALARAASFRPEVALLDIGLPTMDGYALFRQLRTLPGLAAITAFAVTGYGQDHDRARSRAAGLAGHFVKPVNPAEVLRVVAAAPSP
jgi:CheY-like chemotaxis protein